MLIIGFIRNSFYTPAIFLYFEIPFYIRYIFCILKFFLHLPYFVIRNFLYIYTRSIFEFGNSFLHPLYFCIRIFFFKSTLFLYSEIPFSFPLYSCIREFHFHRYIIVFRNPFIHFLYFLFGNSCLPLTSCFLFSTPSTY